MESRSDASPPTDAGAVAFQAPFVELAELLHSIGWRDPCDAQWSQLRDAMPRIAAITSRISPEPCGELLTQAKWLRQCADEIAKEGHAGWGNTCLHAAEAIERHSREPREQLAEALAQLNIARLLLANEANRGGTWATECAALLRSPFPGSAPTKTERRFCCFEDCDQEATHGNYCDGHHRQEQYITDEQRAMNGSGRE